MLASSLFTLLAAAASVLAQDGPANCQAPANVNGNTLYPWLILPVQQSHPDTAYGSQLNVQPRPGQDVILQYYVPSPRPDGVCSLQFALPPNRAITLGGDRVFKIKKWTKQAGYDSTWNSVGGISDDGWSYITANADQGNLQIALNNVDCQAGQTVSFVIRSASTATLDVFENRSCATSGLVVLFNNQLSSA